MPALGEYTNIYNSSLNILKKKGYQSWYDDENELFCAEKAGWDFMAESPCGLLGIVAMFEFVQPKKYEEDWWKIEDEDLYKNIPNKPKEYISVVYRRKNN